MQQLTLTRLDDWHLHLRDGDVLASADSHFKRTLLQLAEAAKSGGQRELRARSRGAVVRVGCEE